MAASIASKYYARLKNQSGISVAVFDSWLVLEFLKELNGVGYYVMGFQDTGDALTSLFELDGQLEIYRTVPGVGLAWYKEFEGLHRTFRRSEEREGQKIFISAGVGYNHLLARTSIMYKAGTIMADKNLPAESAMKEYVLQNCTSVGDDSFLGRLNYDQDTEEFLYPTALPGFTVEADNGNGETWTGSRAYAPLLSTLQDIANFSQIDFNVVGNGAGQFLFKTFGNETGFNRLKFPTGIQPEDVQENPPQVVFSVPLGVVQNMGYELERLAEATAVAVLGKGEGSTRKTVTRINAENIDDSPWNRCEITRPITNYDEDYETYSLQVAGDEILKDLQPKENFDFTPLQQPSQLYGKHYFLGDIVKAKFGAAEQEKRVTAVKISVGGNQPQESIDITMSDIPK